MGLFEGRARVKRATTAPHSNLTIDVFISNNKLGKRVSKSLMEPPDPDTEPPDRRLRLPGFLTPARALRHRPPPAGDEPPPLPPPPAPPQALANGCNGHSEPVKRRLTEAQKLMISSECHKTEIFATKLRHIPGRPNGVSLPPPQQNGERPRRRRRSEEEEATTPRKRITHDSLLLRDNHEYYKVEILTGKLRSSRRLSGDSDDHPSLELDTPDDVGPEDSCDSFRVVRRGSGRLLRGRGPCGTPHGCRPPPEPRPAENGEASETEENGAEPAAETAEPVTPAAAPPQLGFTFEMAPNGEQWYQTYSRETQGQSVVSDLSDVAAAGVGPRLPYQMSEDELFPPEPPPSTSSSSSAPRAKHRRLLQLTAASSARKSPRCHASTRAARCSVDAAEGVALWDSSLEQVQLVAASISSLLTAAEEQHEPLAPPAAGRRRRRRTASLSEPELELPAHLSGVTLASPAPLELGDLLRAGPLCPPAPSTPLSSRQPQQPRRRQAEQPPPPPAPRQRRQAQQRARRGLREVDSDSESEASSSAGRRRRGGRRRSNRTGWPRSRTRRPVQGLLQRAVSRAAATVRAARASRRRARAAR
ncbi:nuclear pore complex-interacting protein family member B13-like [Amphibalanus amphitrite]|uniref:nuclear pore complex-interacting protein family member B13-like n=1 Tax=Amphibalanus amphitrite TaxID=1232801 RepID=UPI001C91F5CC|nr:nuclear pore complex-interacting protein family member B13-like [Amphibalanus amphitrite]